jgi:hypothetical protein
LATFVSGADAGFVAGFASRPLTLTSGATLDADLTLNPTPLGFVGGHVVIPMLATLDQLQQYYRLKTPDAVIVWGNDLEPTATFNYAVPDLSSVGATLCMAAVGNSATLWTERCGFVPGSTDTVLTLQLPPSLSAPKYGAIVSPTSPFSWSSFGDDIFLLSLETPTPSRLRPNIYVFTSKTTTNWPETTSLRSVVPFPPGAPYSAVVTGFAPFSSVDDAFGAAGLGGLVRAETRQSRSQRTVLTTSQ